MICELFPFQKQAVNDMRLRVAMALNNYRMLKIPQVVSLQAPTGSGKTIIMSALIEDIFYGSEQFTEQPDAIFVWLSDSPQLNEQSKQKIEQKADKIRIDQCVVISDESFDREILEDGHIYFLNTQKLGKAGNLSRHSDTRQYTIWETIENTAREKADRLYFIIDEAHRGMQGRQAGTATTIMQRFIKGSSEQNLSPIPVVIGMSATAERFNSLVGQATNSTLHKVVISPAQVRQSGLLKDRIVITYPEDPIKHGDMAVLQAATDEWQDKCKHWYQYTYEQHYPNVNPVFVIQVCAGSGTKVSDTDLGDVIAKIEERMGDSFKENEVVHTFGSTGTLSIHGLTVPHIEPFEIAEDRRIRVVLFKENLSTGWDCPRAETMMSFRRAEDATYIAQLLGRMVRTPLQCHVLVDDSLNDVRLFLPYFNQDTVQKVIDELQATEGGEIPTVVDGESLEDQTYDTWSVHNQKKKTQKQTVGQLSIFDYPNGFQEEPAVAPSTAVDDMSNAGAAAANQGGAASTVSTEGHQKIPLDTVPGNDVHTGRETERTNVGNQPVNKEQPVLTPVVSQMSMLPTIDREGITKFINEQGYLTYIVRAVKINSYLKSLMSLAGLLSQFNICITAACIIELSDYLLIDVGIRFCQMHSLREEALLEIILYPMVLIKEKMLHAIIPMNINGIAQEEDAVTSLLQLQESLLFLIRNLHQHLVGSIDDFFIRHISSSQLTGCIAKCFGGNHSHTQFAHQLHPFTLRIRIHHQFPHSYRLESPDTSFRIELHQDITQIKYDILVLHNLYLILNRTFNL